MGEKNKKPTFTEAVQAIVESHTRLYDLLMEVLPAYRGEAEMPPRDSQTRMRTDAVPLFAKSRTGKDRQFTAQHT
jgi:hypothetical protein